MGQNQSMPGQGEGQGDKKDGQVSKCVWSSQASELCLSRLIIPMIPSCILYSWDDPWQYALSPVPTDHLNTNHRPFSLQSTHYLSSLPFLTLPSLHNNKLRKHRKRKNLSHQYPPHVSARDNANVEEQVPSVPNSPPSPRPPAVVSASLS